MKTNHLLFITFLLLLCTSNLSAQTQAEMNQTAYKDFQKADAELNKAYQKLMSVVNKKEKQLLIKAQKAWLVFRDSHCDFEANQYEGGSIQPLIYSSCLTERTNARIEDLKASLVSRTK